MSDPWRFRRSREVGENLGQRTVEWVRKLPKEKDLDEPQVLLGAIIALSAAVEPPITDPPVTGAGVLAELQSLLSYAEAVGRSHERSPDRAELVDAGRGYLGGALTTMLHLGLLTEAQYDEWFDRCNAPLPPTQWIGG